MYCAKGQGVNRIYVTRLAASGASSATA
jgi:hypothetical protein